MKTSAMKLQMPGRGCAESQPQRNELPRCCGWSSTQPRSASESSDQSIVPSALSPELAALDDSLRHQLWLCELAILGAILVALNLPLLGGEFSTRFIYHPIPIAAGEWWRLFTHPFVHVSPYHLVLDAAAFFLAYVELKQWRLFSRLTFLGGAAAGGLLAALAASPLISTHGLCGLSGIAHGLTAIVSLELLRRAHDHTSAWTAALCFVGVVAKSVLEAATGNVLFASWHLGSLGTPIAACHAGGILGALAAWILLRDPKLDRPSCAQPSLERKPARFRLTTSHPFAGMPAQSHANSSIATSRRVGPDGKPAGG